MFQYFKTQFLLEIGALCETDDIESILLREQRFNRHNARVHCLVDFG